MGQFGVPAPPAREELEHAAVLDSSWICPEKPSDLPATEGPVDTAASAEHDEAASFRLPVGNPTSRRSYARGPAPVEEADERPLLLKPLPVLVPQQPVAYHEEVERPSVIPARQSSGNTERRRHVLEDPDSVPAAAARVSFRDLAELRSFRNPPAVVCQVMEAVAVLLGVTDARWAKVRKLLDSNFLARICSLEPSTLTWAQGERLKVLLQVPTFSDESLVERCPPVVSLAAWCNAVGHQLDRQATSTTGRREHREREQSRLPCGPGASDEVEQNLAQASLWPPPICAAGSPAPALASGSRSTPVASGRMSSAGSATHRTPQDRQSFKGLTVTPDLRQMTEDELASVENLTVSRDGVGCVTFQGKTDCRELMNSLADIVVLMPGEVIIYPNQDAKPPVGTGLNKPATVVLYGCHPKTQGFKDAKAREKYRLRVQVMTEEKGAEFVDYDCDGGVWQFRVNHF